MNSKRSLLLRFSPVLFYLFLAVFLLIALPTHGISKRLSCPQALLSATSRVFNFGVETRTEVALPLRLRLLVWNVHKGQHSQLHDDLIVFGAADTNLMLFQEAVSDNRFVNPLGEIVPSFGWTMAQSYRRKNGDYTGVATGSSIRPVREEVLVSQLSEPISNTPKTLLVSEFPIGPSSETVVVANIHAINFVTSASYFSHIDQLVEAVRHHTGPLSSQVISTRGMPHVSSI